MRPARASDTRHLQGPSEAWPASATPGRGRLAGPIAQRPRCHPGFIHGLLVLGFTACAGCATGGAPAEDLTPDADGVITTRSGLKLKILTQGVGPKPTTRDRVLVHYFCALADGTVVDSSYDRGEPEVLALTDLIRGFRETLQLMAVGSHFRVAVPARLGYGREGVKGLIPPNALLIFEIQLYSILDR